jgi:hypothetical protein
VPDTWGQIVDAVPLLLKASRRLSDPSHPAAAGKVAQISLAAGGSYQLVKRRVLNPAVAEKSTQ